MKNIIVPTDFSENAFNAFIVAYSLATKHDASITLLHVYQEFKTAFQSSEANTQDTLRIQNEAQTNVEQFQHRIESLNLDSSLVHFTSVAGDLTETLREMARQQPIDLIVMGTTGASGIKYHFLGSNTFDVARKTRIPLLVVPIGVTQFELENIAFFTDFQPQDRLTLSKLIQVFGQTSVNFTLIHIAERKGDAEATTQQKLDDWATQLRDATGLARLATKLVPGKEDLEVISRIADQPNTDLLALTMVERSFWELFLDKSLSKAIILQSKVPVFVINN